MSEIAGPAREVPPLLLSAPLRPEQQPPLQHGAAVAGEVSRLAHVRDASPADGWDAANGC
jgi:hypothetical protein